jgi:hypothetical protein
MNDVRVVRDPDEIIGNFCPRYTDDRFSTPRTVYLAPGYHENALKGLSLEYSDRLRDQHGEKHEKAWKASQSSGLAICSGNQVERYLQLLLKNSRLRLILIKASFTDTGHPLREYYFIDS